MTVNARRACVARIFIVNAIRKARTPPPTASRALAILHVSVFDAVNGTLRTHQPYLVQGVVPASDSTAAAASAAAHRVLSESRGETSYPSAPRTARTTSSSLASRGTICRARSPPRIAAAS